MTFAPSLFGVSLAQVAIDPKHFQGLDSVADAVAHLQSGRSLGKVHGTVSRTMVKDKC